MKARTLSAPLLVVASICLAQPESQKPPVKIVPKGWHLESEKRLTGEQVPRDHVEAPPPREYRTAPANPEPVIAPDARDDFGDLSRWRVELRGLGGINYSINRRAYSPRVPASFGGSIGFGLASFAGLTATFSHNNLGSTRVVVCIPGLTCGQPTVSGSIQDLTGGVRIWIPRLKRVTPYGSFAVGAARVSERSGVARVLGFNIVAPSGVLTKFAVVPGGGLDLKLGRGAGFVVDIRAVKPLDLLWYLQPSAGLYLRFR